MDIMERIHLLREYGVADETAYEDLTVIVELMYRRFDLRLTEENAGTMITHLAAAFKRNGIGEEIAPVSAAALEGLRAELDYPRSVEMKDAICGAISNTLSATEQDYLLLHLCTLLYGYNKNTGKEATE